MPRYDYKCKQCETAFFITCGINDSRENISCSECGSTDVIRKFNVIVLKGERARGYQDENVEIKKPENEAVSEVKDKPESSDVKGSDETPQAPVAPIKHDHCSPELDYL
jgi:putative FmdB family regulatory protein